MPRREPPPLRQPPAPVIFLANNLPLVVALGALLHFWFWFRPTFDLAVTDPEGKTIALRPVGSGNTADTVALRARHPSILIPDAFPALNMAAKVAAAGACFVGTWVLAECAWAFRRVRV